jgi:hypothetical protein
MLFRKAHDEAIVFSLQISYLTSVANVAIYVSFKQAKPIPTSQLILKQI